MDKFVKCYLIATPIGDEILDISLKALRVLNRTNFVFCEDINSHTRLRKRFELKNTKLIQFDNKNEAEIFPFIKKLIGKKNDFAILSSSGIPCFCDPGSEIIDLLIREYSKEVKFYPIGVSSALDAALCLVGKYCSNGFIFAGNPSEPFNIKFNYKLKALLRNKLPIILFCSYNNLINLQDFIKKEISNKEIMIITNLAKKEVAEKREQIYKLFFGKISNLKKEISSINKDDDIVLVILNK